MALPFHSCMYVFGWGACFCFWKQGWSSQCLLNNNIKLFNCPWHHIWLWSVLQKYTRYSSASCLTYSLRWLCVLVWNETLGLQHVGPDQESHDVQTHGIPCWVWHQIHHNPEEPGEIFCPSPHILFPDFLWLQHQIELLWGLSELTHIECLELCLTHSKCSVNVSYYYSILSRMLL